MHRKNATATVALFCCLHGTNSFLRISFLLEKVEASEIEDGNETAVVVNEGSLGGGLVA